MTDQRAEGMAPDTARVAQEEQRVRRREDGWGVLCSVTVNDVELAGVAGHWSGYLTKIVSSVRSRTTDDWWLWAYEVERAGIVGNTGGPLGLGVDFFADDAEVAVPAEVRAAIQDDAYEAAREVIVSGLDEHGRRMAAALVAL